MFPMKKETIENQIKRARCGYFAADDDDDA